MKSLEGRTAQVAISVLKKFEAAMTALGISDDLIFYYPVYGAQLFALGGGGKVCAPCQSGSSWAAADPFPLFLNVHAGPSKGPLRGLSVAGL